MQQYSKLTQSKQSSKQSSYRKQLSSYQNQYVRIHVNLNSTTKLSQNSLQVSGTLTLEIKDIIPNELDIQLIGLYILEYLDQKYHHNNSTIVSHKTQQLRSNLTNSINEQENNKNLIKRSQNQRNSTETNIEVPIIIQQYFLDCKQQLNRLDQQGNSLKFLQPSQTLLNYPFIFVIPGNLPPTILGNQLCFAGVKIEISYSLIVKNQLFTYNWPLLIEDLTKKKITKSALNNFDIDNSRVSLSIPKITNSRQLIQKYIKQPGQASICQRAQSQVLSNVYIINIYKYCCWLVSTYNLQVTIKHPTNQYLQLHLYVYKKSTTEQNQFLLDKIFITMYGQLIGLRKCIIWKNQIKLSKAMMSGYQGQSLIDIKNIPKSYTNQLFTLKYWFQVQVEQSKNYRMKIIMKQNQNIWI